VVGQLGLPPHCSAAAAAANADLAAGPAPGEHAALWWWCSDPAGMWRAGRAFFPTVLKLALRPAAGVAAPPMLTLTPVRWGGVLTPLLLLLLVVGLGRTSWGILQQAAGGGGGMGHANRQRMCQGV
jgi:hypothetical protein